MKHFLNVPLERYTAPFDRIWKIVLLHFGIALLTGTIVSLFAGISFMLLVKSTTMYFSQQITQAFCHIVVYYKLDQKYDWMLDTRKRVLYGIIFHVLVTLGLFFTVLPVTIQLLYGISFNEAITPLIKVWVIPVIASGLAILFGVARGFFTNWKHSFAAEEKLNAQMMSYKYESLRNQINPHFLLESFSALKKLVQSDQAKAVLFIQKISNLYRHVLEVKDREFIPLTEELEFISLYLDLLKLRHGDQLIINIDVNAEQDDLIIPLSLQSLIEHAIEGNLKTSHDTLQIKIQRMQNKIELLNSRHDPNREIMPNYAGLKTIEQQYQFYSKKLIQYAETPIAYSVTIPVLKQA